VGLEYKISCEPSKVAEFDAFLRRQPYFHSYDAEHRCYQLQLPGSLPADPPLAYVTLEVNGIYFCDNLAASDYAAIVLRSLIDHALGHSDSVTITEP
jgi:hypothetical protein